MRGMKLGPFALQPFIGLVALVALVAQAAACGGASPEPQSPADGAARSNAAALPRGSAKVEVPASLRAVVDAPDRDAEDRALDVGRRPAELLAFLGIKPGMRVAELGAGGGYSTELLARAVAPGGVVYGQNTAELLAKFADKAWAARLAKPVNKSVVNVTREFEEPFPPEAKDLDAVLCNLFYHDLFWLGADRARMNAAVFKALKPGGVYVVTDHSGRAGSAATEVKSIHRIEEKLVKDEIERVGFKLVAEGEFLRNAEDRRDWNTAPFAAGDKRGTSDRFALKFVKP
jgi:predicted methyltransferase